MPKEKIRSIEAGAYNGDIQEIIINNKVHDINIHWSKSTIHDELSKYYEFDDISTRELEAML